MRFDSTPYYHLGSVYPWDKMVDEMRDEARLLEQGGFTGVWIAEHHFAWDGWLGTSPNPLMLGQDLAAHTDTLRIGQCGVILPDWHPLRVAEDVALLDHFSKGRVDFGVARGLNSRASIQFHPDADRRDHDRSYALFAESLDIVKKAWTEDAFTYSGEFYRFPEPGWIEPSTSTRDTRFHSPDGELIALGVHPKPYQKPHPPMWQMGDSIPSHRFAASRGMGNICLALSYEKIREAWGIYNEVSLETEGRDLQPGEKVAVMRPTYIAETYEEAVNDVRDGFNMFGEWAKHDPRKVRTRMAFEHELTEEDYNLSYFDFNLKHDLILVGSPESVREQIEELISETGCRHLALFLNFPALTFEQVMRSLDLFASEIIPHFK